MTKKSSVPKKKPNKESIDSRIDKLLTILNQPQTNCEFWKVSSPHYHIAGVRPVTKETIKVLNPDSFNPYEDRKIEMLFKYFKILITEESESEFIAHVDTKTKIEKNGTIYLVSHDLIWIYEQIRSIT